MEGGYLAYYAENGTQDYHKQKQEDVQKIGDILRLVRYQNLIFVAILLWVMEKWVAVPILDSQLYGEQLPWYVLLLLIAATVCVAAGGYVVNDYFDVKIDRINHPDKLIVTNTISKTAAVRIGWALSGVGIVCGLAAAWLVRSWSLSIIYVFVPGLLWFYSSSYKRRFLIGNIVVAFVAALTPMVIAFANVGLLRSRYGVLLEYTPLERDLYVWLGGFALFAFLCTLIREIIKDMQDKQGDCELECRTLPIRLGETWTKVIVTLLIVLTMGLIGYVWYALLPFPHVWQSLSTRYMVFGLQIPFVCELWLLWAARIPSDYRGAQGLMKLIMFLGMLFSFVVMRLL